MAANFNPIVRYIDKKQAEEIAKILKLEAVPTHKDNLILHIEKEWSEMTKQEQFDHVLDLVHKLDDLEKAKAIYSKVEGVKHAHTLDQIAALVWAATRQARDHQCRCGDSKKCPRSTGGIMEFHANGRHFSDGFIILNGQVHVEKK